MARRLPDSEAAMAELRAHGKLHGGPEWEPDRELERLRQELLQVGIREAILRTEIEARLRESASLLDASRRLREASTAAVDRRRRTGAARWAS